MFNKILAYIFLCLFSVPVVGMEAERVNPSKECYESNQRKLTFILCAFRQENIGLPDEVGRIIAFKYAEKEIVESKQLAENMQCSCHSYLANIEKRNACSLIDLLFLNKDQRCGMLTMSGIDNIYRLVSWTSGWRAWEWLSAKVREMAVNEAEFNQTMLVPRRLREKLFAGSDSIIKVSKLVEHYEDHFDEFITRKAVFEQRSFLEDIQLCIADK